MNIDYVLSILSLYISRVDIKGTHRRKILSLKDEHFFHGSPPSSLKT